jgi:UTP--glucose-1-phosphate uridylyltransferase
MPMRPSVRKAVIPAAGLGTRFLPATKAQPKEMLPLVDKPAIQYVVEEAVRAGLRDILIITGRGKRSLEDHFDRSFELEHYLEVGGKFDQLKEVRAIAEMADIHYVRQGEPRGLGHAVAVAADHVGDEPFVVLLGDDVMSGSSRALAEMLGVHERYGRSVVALKEVPRSEISAYGCVRTEAPGPRLPRLPVRPRAAQEAGLSRSVFGLQTSPILRARAVCDRSSAAFPTLERCVRESDMAAS